MQLLADTINAGEGIIGSVVEARRAEMVNDVLADPRTAHHPRHGSERRTTGSWSPR